MLLIQNGYVYNPKTKSEGERDILIEGDRIVRIAPKGTLGGAAAGSSVIDAAGLKIAPGLVDIHVHFRDPGFTYKEDIESGALAAAAGGFTSVVLMANTKPPVDTVETLSYVLDKGRKTGIHVETCACVTKGMQGRELVDMQELLAAGAAGFTDDGIPLLDEAAARQAMAEAARLHTVISLHEEDPAFIQNNGINAGRAAAHFGVGGSDRQAEIALVERDIRLAQETGASINIQHISTKEAVDLVRLAKQKGVRVYAEATPHHIALTQEALLQYGTLAKMNPPLREEEDRLAIMDGLQDGTIDFIATDHAPHSAQEKAQNITMAPSGIIGLETALPLCITALVRTGRLTLRALLAKMTCNPADFYGLDAGYLAEGGPADLVIFDDAASCMVTHFASKSQNSPFTGSSLYGVIKHTICGGREVYPARTAL